MRGVDSLVSSPRSHGHVLGKGLGEGGMGLMLKDGCSRADVAWW